MKKTSTSKKLNTNKKPGKKAEIKKVRNWQRIAINGVITLVIGAASLVGLGAYKNGWEAERELSVVGNGMPTIVQVHDSGCQLCRKLKSNTEKALKGFGDKVQYRIADIKTPHGKKFQRKYDVPHVTLLLFDGKGKLKSNLNGVKSSETLKVIFEGLVDKGKKN